MAAANSVSKLDNKSLDWIGIHSTWLNADFVKTILGKIACNKIVENPTKKIKFDNVLVAGGWKPGCSTDYDAVLLAKTFGAKTIIKIGRASCRERV